MAILGQFRGDLRSEWERVNPVIHEREFILVKETNDGPWTGYKIGDGVSKFKELPYASNISILQVLGESETATISQAAITKEFYTLYSYISYEPKSIYEDAGSYWGSNSGKVNPTPNKYTAADYAAYAGVDKIFVRKGDKFLITSKGTPSINVYMFTDAERNIIEQSGVNASLVDVEIVAPADGFLFVTKTGMTSFEKFKLIRKNRLSNIIELHSADIATLFAEVQSIDSKHTTSINKIEEDIKNVIKPSIQKNSESVRELRIQNYTATNGILSHLPVYGENAGPIAIYEKTMLRYNGALDSNGTSTQITCDFKVSPNSFVLVDVRIPGSNSYAGIAFLKDDEVVEVFNVDSLSFSGNLFNYPLVIPKNVNKLRLYREATGEYPHLKTAFSIVNSISNVDNLHPPTSEFHTKETARASIPRSERITGLIITYTIANRKYVKEQYLVPSLSDENWVNDEYWRSFTTETEVNELKDYIDKNVLSESLTKIDYVSKGEGYVLTGLSIGSLVQFGTHSSHFVYDIEAGQKVRVTASSGGSYGFVMCDLDNRVLEKYANSEGSLVYTFKVYNTNTILYTSSPKTVSVEIVSEVHLKELIRENAEEIEKVKADVGFVNYWTSKKIWWCGTSIPAGSDSTLGSEETIAGMYPKQVGINLGATVYNEAVGGSMCRANVRTGDYNGANISNITSALSMTEEEVESFIANYDTLRQLPKNNAWPSTLSSSNLSRLRNASFEKKLLPYLNGTKQFPDLFVIDHGHNDWKYNKSDGNSDITLEPTLANIQSGELAEDTYMTANNNENLEKFFGSLADIPSGKKEAFVASVNRNCYIGAINFIVTLILKYNPHARFVFISNYEFENGDGPGYAPLINAQESLAKSWAFPLCEVYKYLGFSNHIIPGSMNWFNTEYPSVTAATSDVTCFRAYNPDTVEINRFLPTRFSK